jgi:hypothetical protein
VREAEDEAVPMVLSSSESILASRIRELYTRLVNREPLMKSVLLLLLVTYHPVPLLHIAVIALPLP